MSFSPISWGRYYALGHAVEEHVTGALKLLLCPPHCTELPTLP